MNQILNSYKYECIINKYDCKFRNTNFNNNAFKRHVKDELNVYQRIKFSALDQDQTA